MTSLYLIYGLGIFLFGMNRIERSLEQASQHRLRHWLTQYTRHPLAAVAMGVAITAALQSSSLVTLLMMALASSGLVPLMNAVGVVVGANLGTTVTGWIVTTLGFKLPLSEFGIPLLGVGTLIFLIFIERPQLKAVGRFLLGLGCLLFGLDLMKSSVEHLPDIIDFVSLSGFPPFVFLLAGAALTAVIQSSSATMMITLTLLHGGLIALPDAAAFIIGADLGTTSTSALGALTGRATRKRLATAHIVFNVIIDLLAFFLLLPLLPYWLLWLNLSDPLYSLVLFHSAFNLFGLILFIPWLKPFTRWLEHLFIDKETEVTRFIQYIPPHPAPLAIEALQRDVALLFPQCLNVIDRGLGSASAEPNYVMLKKTEGELVQYGAQLSTLASNRALQALREWIIACRTTLSIQDDWGYLALLGTDDETDTWQQHYHALLSRLRAIDPMQLNTQLWQLQRSVCVKENLRIQRHMLTAIDQYAKSPTSDEVSLSSLLNLNREIFSALEHLILGMDEFLLTEPVAEEPDRQMQ